MTDFDFDELDRAVNGATNTAPTPQPASTAETTRAQAPTVAPAARRSSGRFMDVVHPSSDMRSGIAPSRPASSTPVNTAATESGSTPLSPESTDTQPQEAEWQKPLESPFLPDAKVEKRPLGGEAPSATDFDPLELLEAPDDPRLEAHTMPDPIDFATQTETDVDAEEPAPLPEEISTPEANTEQPVAGAGYGEGSFQPAVQDETPVGPASINQQYQEQPSSSPEPGTIYDTEAYHQPVTGAVKKKSGAWVILWIVLILLLGAGAGVAFYFYVLPLL